MKPQKLFASQLSWLFSSMMIVLFVLFTSLSATAQTTSLTPASISGSIDIRYDSRTRPGATDTYVINMNVSGSTLFRGNIINKPFAKGGTFSADKFGSLDYDISCDIVNPKNPQQTANVGKLFGTVPIDGKNIYRYDDGSVRISVLPRGVAKGFDSKFKGLAYGKAPATTSTMDSFKSTLNFSKTVNGKTVGIVVTKYDKMEFQNHILAAGPVQIYPEATVNGTMIYDDARSAWYFNGIQVFYAVDGHQLMDKLSGTIRWVEAPDRKTSGIGEYQFDVRLNEPAANEGAVFAASQDESAFFETDNTVASLTGTMKYKDAMVGGGSPTSSSIKVDLVGNKITKQQAMYLFKLIVLSSVVPFNAE